MISPTGAYLTSDMTGHVHDAALAAFLPSWLIGLGVESVLDLGCGAGLYGVPLASAGITYRGYDGNPNVSAMSGGVCRQADLSAKVSLGTSDCVLSLEVGEHIPAEYEDVFLRNVASHARNLIILSWAIEGQGGHGHVNCRNNDYIIMKMRRMKWQYRPDYTDKLRSVATLPWFKNTIMVFA